MSDTKLIRTLAALDDEERCDTCGEMGLAAGMIRFGGKYYHPDCDLSLARCPWCGDGGEKKDMLGWDGDFYHPTCIKLMMEWEEKK